MFTLMKSIADISDKQFAEVNHCVYYSGISADLNLDGDNADIRICEYYDDLDSALTALKEFNSDCEYTYRFSGGCWTITEYYVVDDDERYFGFSDTK